MVGTSACPSSMMDPSVLKLDIFQRAKLENSVGQMLNNSSFGAGGKKRGQFMDGIEATR